MKELILGTAQLGLCYGVNNKLGKLSKEAAFSILDTAFENGITTLDTASAYGDSEELIGSFMRDRKVRFKIASKLSNLDLDSLSKSITIQIEKSLESLGTEYLDCIYIHKFNDIVKCPEILDILYEKKILGKIKKIGVSLYDTEELEYLKENCIHKIDVIQIPFNIFDLRWVKSSILENVRNNGIYIVARSIYLQGLIFLEKQSADKVNPEAYNYIQLVNAFCNENDISVNRFAMIYALTQKNIDGILIGCESKEQVIANIEMFNTKYNRTIESKIVDYAKANFSMVDAEIRDPRLWHKLI
ncbi:MAG: aldo/keto reductase [Clostridia bacterium]